MLDSHGVDAVTPVWMSGRSCKGIVQPALGGCCFHFGAVINMGGIFSRFHEIEVWLDCSVLVLI